MKKFKINSITIFSIIIFILIDQFTKLLAIKKLKDNLSFSIIPHIFELQYLENRGAAFGILQGQKYFFVIITVIFLAILFYIYNSIPGESKYVYLRIVMILFFSGAIGNFIDRIKNNYVVDFFYFTPVNFPIFNVADIYVTSGAFFLIVLVLFYYKEDDFAKIFSKKGEL